MTITEYQDIIDAMESTSLVFKAIRDKYRSLLKKPEFFIATIDKCENINQFNDICKSISDFFESGSEITKTIQTIEESLPELKEALDALKKGEQA